MEVLKVQSHLLLIVFGDFNKILHPDEKLGGLDRDTRQMREFRDCLNMCGLFDLGFVGQRYTWCNGWFGEQRTKLRLDRMVVNESWWEKFPEAMVHHYSMSILDHYLLTLFLHRRQPKKQVRKRFFFEAMLTTKEGCREVIEEAWNLMKRDPEFRLTDRLRSCKERVQSWNGRVFGIVNKILRQKQGQLQQLEVIDGVLIRQWKSKL